MKPLETVLEEANKSYDKDTSLPNGQPNPELEPYRVQYVLGYLKGAYKVLFSEFTNLKNSKKCQE